MQKRIVFINFAFHFIMASKEDTDTRLRKDADEEPFYVISDDEIDSGTNLPGETSPFRLFLKVMISPVDGWKKLKRAAPSPETMAQGCYYPVLAVLAVSCFATMFYVSNIRLQTLVVEALIGFISYFLGYFTVIMVLRTMLPSDCRPCFDAPFGKNFVMVAMTSIALVSILIQLLPFLQPVLVFLPMYTVFIVVKGVRFLRAPKRRETLLMVSVSMLTIGMPLLLQWFFDMMMPG